MSRLCLDRAAITALSVPMGGLRGKAAAACLLLLIVSLPSCSENASETRIRELEARIERQEIANEQLRRRLGGMLDGLALRMDRVVDALGEGAPKASAPVADVTPIPTKERAESSSAERVVASPVNPADALARDRRTGAWVAALAAVVGATPLARTEVVSKMWTYIKKHGLQDKVNKRNINADDKLRAVFGKAQVTMFELASLIGKHLK